MSEWPDLAGYGIHGLVTGVVLVGVFFVQTRLKLRADRVRFAGMLLIELAAIYESVSPFTPYGFPRYRTGAFSTNVYDGLVSSAELSKFDDGLQELLHKVYRGVKNGNLNDLDDSVYQIYHDVSYFRFRNEWKRLNKMTTGLALILDPRSGTYAPDEYKMPGMWWLWFLSIPIVVSLLGSFLIWIVGDVGRQTELLPFVIVWTTGWWLLSMALAVSLNAAWLRIKAKDAKLARQLRAVSVYAIMVLSVGIYIVALASIM